LHFYSVAALASYQHLQLGTCLRNFAVQLADCEGISKAVATTRCSHFVHGPSTSAKSFLHYALEAKDPTLQFHVSGGAKVTGVIANYRPEDHGNLGHAVVAEYVISTSEPEVQQAPVHSIRASQISIDHADVSKGIIEELSSVLGCSVSHDRAQDLPFMDLGLDSLGVIMFCNQLCSRFNLKLSASDIFDHPNVRSLVAFICNLSGSAPYVQTLNRRPSYMEPIAVVGMNCVFPGGCNSVEDFWLGLCSGRDFTSDVPGSWNTETRKFRAGLLQEVQRCEFDPEYFGLSLSELQSL
jgi:KS-AT-KR-ACP domain-containing polyene macrolide polyketide synthase/pimaricinolide synthase PimS2/candicidin polyketide synthase FscD